jgi:hypothetical protein
VTERYLHTAWRTDNPDMPVDIYSEFDADGWEIRKVEAFADGRIQYSDGVDSTGGTGLSEVREEDFPDGATVSGPLTTTPVDAATFESWWQRATQGRS